MPDELQSRMPPEEASARSSKLWNPSPAKGKTSRPAARSVERPASPCRWGSYPQNGPSTQTARKAEKQHSQLLATNMKRLLIMGAMLMLGCTTRTVRIPADVITVPSHTPSYPGAMTISEAADVLKLIPPVRVTYAASFEDGGTVQIAIKDSKDNAYAFRRSPWARREPVHFFIDYPKKDGAPEKLEWDDPRLKAFSLLALNWVDSLYPRKQQRRIFTEEFMDEKPFDDQKARASEVLWLFRKEELKRQQ